MAGLLLCVPTTLEAVMPTGRITLEQDLPDAEYSVPGVFLFGVPVPVPPVPDQPATPPKSNTIGYVHHSGRYDHTGDQLGQVLVEQARTHGVSLIGLTEVASVSRRAGAVKHLDAIGWGVAGPAGSECALAYDRAAFKVLHATEVQVSTVKTWSTAGKLRAPFKVLLVSLLSLVDGETYTVSVGHTPSHVQAGDKWLDNNRSRQHRDGFKGWHQALAAYGRTHPATGGRIVSMDLNLDVRRPVWRAYLAATFPALALIHDATYTGTLGGRAIDVVLVSRNLTALVWWNGRRVRVVDARDSDHDSVIVRLGRAVVAAVTKAKA